MKWNVKIWKNGNKRKQIWMIRYIDWKILFISSGLLRISYSITWSSFEINRALQPSKWILFSKNKFNSKSYNVKYWSSTMIGMGKFQTAPRKLWEVLVIFKVAMSMKKCWNTSSYLKTSFPIIRKSTTT